MQYRFSVMPLAYQAEKYAAFQRLPMLGTFARWIVQRLEPLRDLTAFKIAKIGIVIDYDYEHDCDYDVGVDKEDCDSSLMEVGEELLWDGTVMMSNLARSVQTAYSKCLSFLNAFCKPSDLNLLYVSLAVYPYI